VTFTILYVLPFYLSPLTRPSPTISRDAPSVIRARIRYVTCSVIFTTIATIYILSSRAHASPFEVLHLLGWYPISILDITRVLLLTGLLFFGPVFERGVVESGWRDWIRGRSLHETLRSWIGWRNYVAVRTSFLSLPLVDTTPSRYPVQRSSRKGLRQRAPF
jgi:prenyl protein peptidase